MASQTSKPQWRVTNYQIPVPIGDCSAHFLVDKGDGKVKKAFLMDGGTNAGGYHAWVQILKGLRHIDLELGCDWKFDSWVVTHWDDDHYRGVRDLLSSDLKMSRCVQNGPDDFTGRTTSAPFAEQYFNSQAWLLCGALDHAMFNNGKRPYINFLKPFMNANNQNIDLRATFGSLKDTGYKNDTVETYKLINKAGLRCIASQPLVGLDLFTRTRQFTSDGQYRTKQLTPVDDSMIGIGANPQIDQPCFCVIGANGHGLGIKKRHPDDPSRNETSILAVLYWPGDVGGGHCSYYTGGDGHPELAKDIVETWMNTKDKCKPNGEVDLMKLDHHGSTKENLGHKEDPAAKADGSKKRTAEQVIDGVLYKKLKPKGLLVTPGNRHGHPTWDVLLEIHNYFTERESSFGLFTTRSFYWLNTQEPPGIKNLNAKHNGIQYMQQLYKGIWDKYYDIGQNSTSDEDDDVDVLEHDLIVLDQPHRVKAQAEYEKQRQLFGEFLLAKERKEFIQKDKINWSAVNDLIHKECQRLLSLGAPDEELDNNSHDLTRALFFAWYDWAWNVYEAQTEGAEQFAGICWQPIISDTNPHFLIRFAFDDNGKTTSIDVFSDDGGSQFVRQENDTVTPKTIDILGDDEVFQPVKQDKYTVTCTPTNLVVADGENWVRLVYTPLGIATIFDHNDVDSEIKKKGTNPFKTVHTGLMNDLKLVNDVVFKSGQPADPKKSTGVRSKKPLSPAQLMKLQNKAQLEKKLKVEGLIEGYNKDKRLIENEMKMDAAEEEWFLKHREPRRKGQIDEPTLLSYKEREIIKLKSIKVLRKLSDKGLKAVLEQEEVCYFAWQYVKQTRGVIAEIKGANHQHGQPQSQAHLDTLIRDVYFFLVAYEFDHGAEEMLKKKQEKWKVYPERQDYFDFLMDTYCSGKTLKDFQKPASML